MSHPLSPSTHPVLACAARLGRALADVADTDPVFMRTADKEAALVELAARAAQLDELRLRVLGASDDVAEQHGARDAAAWLGHEVRMDDAAARGDLTVARVLERRPALAGAMRAGLVDRARVLVVAKALDDLPDDVPADVVARAEDHLLQTAREFSPGRLRNLGRKVLEVVAPDVHDELERRLLERDDARAAAVTSLHTRRRGDGTTDVRIRCADHVADRLLTYLESFTSPRQDAGDRRPYPQRLGDAFGSLLETLDPRRLPVHGGDATTVVVTLDLQTLLTGIGIATIDDQPITAAQARRLACTAQLVPMVLGGDSEILDQGRSQRLYQRPQRKAMAVRDVTCRGRGCTIPAAWCEAHHLKAWAQGGLTDLGDGVLLCSHHHHLAHDHRYELRRHPDGDITFHRRV